MYSFAARSAGQKSRDRWLIAIGAALVLLASVWSSIFAAPSTKVAAAATTPAAALTVTTAAAQPERWMVTIDASGSIVPWQEASVSARMNGLRLVEVRADVGDVVRRGQLLARFDTDTLQAEEAQLRAAVAEAQAAASQADANRRRVLTLKAAGAISERNFLEDMTQAETAQAQLGGAQAQLLSKQLELRYAEVLAPDDGVVSLRDAMLGVVASSGDELFRLIRQNRLEWRGELTASQLAQIATGQIVTLTLPDGHTAAARVRMTSPTLDAQSRLGIVYAEIEPGSRARAGMYASGHIDIAQTAALSVPAASVVIRDGRSYVFRLEQSNVVAAQAVTVGRRHDGRIEIKDGLRAGQRVAVNGAGFLNDGDVVQVAAAVTTR